MPIMFVEPGKDYALLHDADRLYKAKLEKMFGLYRSFEEIKKRAEEFHLDETEFSIPDKQSYEVPKEVILDPNLIPNFSCWSVQAHALEGMVTREVAVIRAFGSHR